MNRDLKAEAHQKKIHVNMKTLHKYDNKVLVLDDFLRLPTFRVSEMKAGHQWTAAITSPTDSVWSQSADCAAAFGLNTQTELLQRAWANYGPGGHMWPFKALSSGPQNLEEMTLTIRQSS